MKQMLLSLKKRKYNMHELRQMRYELKEALCNMYKMLIEE